MAAAKTGARPAAGARRQHNIRVMKAKRCRATCPVKRNFLPATKPVMKTTPSISLPDSALPESQLRECAYFRWLDLGRPDGDDLAHWFWARQQLGAPELPAEHRPAPPALPSAHFSIQNTVATGSSDPTHRFHDRRTPQDARMNVVAGEARQRVRGRHFDSSLRAQPKKPAH